MPFEIVRNNIVHMQVDAIVNAANASLLGGGGVDGAIHRAAGPQLLEECRGLGGCVTGQAKITRGYRLPARYVIHTVGPVWNGGWRGEENMLRSCYRSSLELARKNGCESVAFPLISAGAYGYPPAEAMRVAMDEIRAFLMHCDMLVYLVVFGQESFHLSTRLSAHVKQYIDDHYVQTHFDPAAENRRMREMPEPVLRSSYAQPSSVLWDACAEPAFVGGEACAEAAPTGASLDEALEQIDESFSQMVLRKIDERGMTDPECYKRANLDRKLFSKIRKDPFYRPNKRTALALAIALKLPLAEAKELLMKAGFALSHSSRFDIIVEYCIVQGMFDIFEINALLFEYDQALLGA